MYDNVVEIRVCLAVRGRLFILFFTLYFMVVMSVNDQERKKRELGVSTRQV